MAPEFNDGSSKYELRDGTPPLYIVRTILSLYATGGNHVTHNNMILYVKGAFIYGDAQRDIYIELPIGGHNGS